MKIGDLGKFKCGNGNDELSNKLFFVSNICQEDEAIEITLFADGQTWIFDYREFHYYADIL